MTTIRIEVEQPYLDDVMAQLQTLQLAGKGKIIIEPLEQMSSIKAKSGIDLAFEQVMLENDDLNKRLA
jgi:hypothetical protein